MPEVSRFFELTDHSETDFAEVLADYCVEGVFQHADQRLAVTAPGGLIVNVAAGRAAVQGFWYRLTVLTGLNIVFNGSGQVRYDRVVLRLERASNRVILGIRQGIGGAGTPALERSLGSTWEISVARITVGPGVTNITPADVQDERGYGAVCGWADQAGYIGAPNIEGSPYPMAVFPNDTNTGLGNAAPDRLNLMAGLKSIAYFDTASAIIGSHDIATAVYSGGTVGAAQERIYSDATYLFLGRDAGNVATYGPHQIQMGTAPRTQYITIGHNGAAPATYTNNISLAGNLSWTMPLAQDTFWYIAVPEGRFGGIAFRNYPPYNKEFHIMFGTAAGQGFGGSGDVSMYTTGTGAGRVILGTQGAARLWIAPGYMAFGSQAARSEGFSFQQATNALAYGIRLYHNNQSHRIQWSNDDAGRHLWGINDTIQMSLFTNGVLTVGNRAPGAGGFNFQQVYNHPAWGFRLYHTNQSHHNDWYSDDTGRHVWALNDTPLMHIGVNVFSLNSAAAKGSGFNWQQGADGIAWGLRNWHTNQSWHTDWFTDGASRLVLGINDVPRFHMAADGKITLGGSATDVAQLHIPAQFGDAEASGIRLSNAGAAARWWVRSDGIVYFGSATTMLWIHHSTNIFGPMTDNVTNLGYPGFRWTNIYSNHGTFSGNVTVTGQISAGGGFVGIPSIPTDPSFNIVTANGYTSSQASVRPPSPGSKQLGQNGHTWADIFGSAFWKPGGGNGFLDSSDDKVKHIDSFRPYDRGLATIMELRPTYFHYTGEYGTTPDREFVGFRAQELQQVAPEMVFSAPISRDAGADEQEDPEDILIADTSNLIYILVRGIQEQQGQIDELRSMVMALQEGAA